MSQGEQLTSEVVVHAVEMRVPALQVLQAEQVPASDVVENEVPATQGVHTAAADTEQAVER